MREGRRDRGRETRNLRGWEVEKVDLGGIRERSGDQCDKIHCIHVKKNLKELATFFKFHL